VRSRLAASEAPRTGEPQSQPQPAEGGPARQRRDGGHRGAGGRELQDAFLDREPEDVRDHHWKISIVQSPF
jgi:hypothetical protein